MKKKSFLSFLSVILLTYISASDIPDTDIEHKAELLKNAADKISQNFVQQKTYGIIQNALRSFLKIAPANMQPISIRQGKDICVEEKVAITTRMKKNQQALTTILHKKKPLAWVPPIGIVASGGGDRAMISTTGFLIGLEKTGLLDACTYFAALSGSTWTGCTWLARNVAPTQLKEFMRKHEITDELKLKNRNFDEIAKALLKKFVHDQYLSLCDIWGSFLADVFFEDLPKEEQEIYLSQFRPLITSGSYPFLICTAIHDKTFPYQWAEFSPFECGSLYLQNWIPTYAFGKEFNEGTSLDAAPELSVGFMMGMFGSAYAVSMKDTLRIITPKIQNAVIDNLRKKNIPPFLAQKFASAFFEKTNNFFRAPKYRTVIDDIRISPPKVYNFTHNVHDSPLSKKTHLTLVDAGIDFNLPFPPLLRRNIPLYFVCDASAGTSGNPLQKAAAYAAREGFKFPAIDSNEIKNNQISLLYDTQDPEVPVIVYIPNQVKFPTTKFEYTDKEFVELSEYMEKIITSNKDLFVQAIKIAIKNHKKITQKNL